MPGSSALLSLFFVSASACFPLPFWGGLAQLVSRWAGVPLFILFVAVGVAAVMVTAL